MSTTVTFTLFRVALFVAAGFIATLVHLNQWWLWVIFMIVLLAIYAVGYVEGQIRIAYQNDDNNLHKQ